MIDINKVNLYPFKERKNKVSIKDFAVISNNIIETFPNILIGKDLREVAEKIKAAKNNNKEIIFMMGAHVIKCGLSRIVIELMRNKYITAIAMNGACIIHDTEIALFGETSESVEENIMDGSFGMARETGEFINNTINSSPEKGMGHALGSKLVGSENEDCSILANAFKMNITNTVHVAIGADIIHQHPNFDGAATGRATYIDFKKLITSVSRLQDGVVINQGSAVILPEVFLKAVSTARNLGYKLDDFTAVNFDMIKQYRSINVVERPAKGYQFIGHHEIMLPILAYMLLKI